MARRRVIYNDDFRTPIGHDQVKFNFPASADEYRGLIERVRGTAITTYVIDAIGRDIFMLVEVDVASVPPSALRTGLNRLWVQINNRRDDALFDLYMGELEIVVSSE